jgi:predicted Zn-dependent protease with MMP-like domain/Flp pilus assembly protein TadD
MAKRALHPSDPEEALRQFDERFEAGDMEAALQLVEGPLEGRPDHAPLHHARGLALWGLERFRSAAESMVRATELDRSLPDPHLDLATLLIDHLGYPEDALEHLKGARRAMTTPELKASLHVLFGRAWLSLEDPRTAVKELRRAVKLAPEDAELRGELAEMQIESIDLAGGRRTLEEAIEQAPDLSRARWLKAVLLDREGDTEAAAGEFREAARLDPDECFVPERLDDVEFDRQVEKALAGIPPRFRRHLENVEIAVEAYPAEAFLREHGVSPLLLGLFMGTPMTLRGFESGDLPPRILVFQRNLENVCRTRRELVREIGITVRHEIGHLLGMEEEDLEDAGHA